MSAGIAQSFRPTIVVLVGDVQDKGKQLVQLFPERACSARWRCPIQRRKDGKIPAQAKRLLPGLTQTLRVVPHAG